MIDNWISEPMKKSGLIWSCILKVMNFLIFRDFSRIFRIYFRFKSFKIIKKRIKRGFIFARVTCGCDVARKATWQSHAGPHEHLCGAEVTHGQYLYLSYIGFIGRQIINPLIRRPLYTREFPFIFTVWDYVPRFVLNEGDVDQREESDQGRDDWHAWIPWTKSPPNHQSRTCLKSGIITVQISRDQTHPKRQITIQPKRFIMHKRMLHPERPFAIWRPKFNHNSSSWCI